MRNHKIDERKDNIRRIKETIENTQDNIEFANDLIDASTNAEHNKHCPNKQALLAQNMRREDSIDTLLDELKERVSKEKKKK